MSICYMCNQCKKSCKKQAVKNCYNFAAGMVTYKDNSKPKQRKNSKVNTYYL